MAALKERDEQYIKDREEREKERTREKEEKEKERAREKEEREKRWAREEKRKAKEAKEQAERTKELDRRFKEAEKLISRVGKQIGDLGNKFGSFTEGMALPSFQKILYQQFGATHVSPRAKARLNGHTLEIDILGYSNGKRNTAVVVEIKSHLKKEDVDQLLRILDDFPQFYPAHKDKALYGILVGVNAPESIRNLAKKKGLYVGQISDETFDLLVPETFDPKNFGTEQDS